MNKIPETQNSLKQLERLAAQRELYSTAKKYYFLESIGSILIPLSLTATSIFITNISLYSALYGISFYLIDSIILEPFINAKKTTAAKIQELFDCDVLEIEKPTFRTINDVSLEEILDNSDSHIDKIASDEKLRDWYAVEVGELDISIARLICQRISCGWDSKLRNTYSSILKFAAVGIAILLITGITLGSLPGEQLPLILAGILPLFRFCIKLYQDNKSSSEKLSKLNTYFDGIWERLKTEQVKKEELDESARRIQNEIFDSRIKSPLIPNFFYSRSRKANESIMNKVTKRLVKELKDNNYGKLAN